MGKLSKFLHVCFPCCVPSEVDEDYKVGVKPRRIAWGENGELIFTT